MSEERGEVPPIDMVSTDLDETQVKSRRGSGKRLTDRQRVEIIQLAEAGEIAKRQIARQYGVSESAIRGLLSNKQEVLQRYYEAPEDVRDQRQRGKKKRMDKDATIYTPTVHLQNTKVVENEVNEAIAMESDNANGLPPPDLLSIMDQISPRFDQFIKSGLDMSKSQEDAQLAGPPESISYSDWESFADTLVTIRRAFHQYPELGFQEYHTQAFIYNICHKILHIPTANMTALAETGLVIDVHAGNAAASNSIKSSTVPILAFRADIDGLPIVEENTRLRHCSLRRQKDEKAPVAAHMCGHDGHMTMVLGLCALVVRHAHLLPPYSFVRFVFQPAEENPGGAEPMIEQGCLDNVDEVYGLHNVPFPLGSVHVQPGPMTAHEIEFWIDITGVGGHGSAPHSCVDPVLIGSAVVQNLQSIVSRSISPISTAVVSVTFFNAGVSNNVIPETAKLGGTIRVFDLALADHIKTKVESIVNFTCEAYGAKGNVRFKVGYDPTLNPEEETRMVQQVAREEDFEVSEEGLPLMAAEDFSYFIQKRKGCLFLLGTKESGDTDKVRSLHSDGYDFNDCATPLGIRMFLGILQKRMQCQLYRKGDMQAFEQAMQRVVKSTASV